MLARSDQTNESHVITVQEFIDGTPIRLIDPDTLLGNSEFQTFVLSAAMMHRATKKISDVACIEKGFFNPLQSPNIIIDENGYPWLVDTTFGRIQRSMLLGRTWNNLIAHGTNKAIRRSPSVRVHGSAVAA